MDIQSTTKTPAIIATFCSVLVVSGIASYFYLKNSHKKDMQSDDDVIDLPDLTKDQIVQILGTINANMQNKVRELGQQMEQIQMQIKASGQSLPEDQIIAYMTQEFETHLQAVEEEVLKKFKTDEDELEYSCAYYEEQDDAEVKEAVTVLEKLYQAVSGSKGKEPPADLTADKLMEMMEEYFDVLYEVIKELADEAQAQGIAIQGPEFQRMLLLQVDSRAQKRLKEVDINMEEFQGAISKFQHVEEVMKKFEQLNMQHQQKSMMLGVMF